MTAFPIEGVREAFPALALTDQGRARAYLDNPAGTQVPQGVIEAVARCLGETNANLGGTFATSKAADAVVRGAHAAMADLLGAASAREVVIGPSMTSLTYRISRSLGRRLEPGDEVVVTRMDHDGNVAPWLQLAEDRGLVVRWLPFDRETWRIEPEALDHVLSEKTRILALNYASNLTGSVNDVAALAARAKAAGALVYVDAVQLAPHRLVDVAALGCDFLVCSSYKFFGPHLGVLWGRGDLLDGDVSLPVPLRLRRKSRRSSRPERRRSNCSPGWRPRSTISRGSASGPAPTARAVPASPPPTRRSSITSAASPGG